MKCLLKFMRRDKMIEKELLRLCCNNPEMTVTITVHQIDGGRVKIFPSGTL